MMRRRDLLHLVSGRRVLEPRSRVSSRGDRVPPKTLGKGGYKNMVPEAARTRTLAAVASLVGRVVVRRCR